MNTRGLRTVLCSIVLTCTGCIVVPDSRPAPRVAAVAPAAVQPVQPGYCREFQQTVTIGGVAQQAYGVSCQQADGSWKIAGEHTAVAPSPRPAAPQVVSAPPPSDGSYLLIPFERANEGDNNKPQR